MNAVGISAILDILVRIIVVAPSLTNAYKKIVDSLHKTGEITHDEWEARKAEYISNMNGEAWKPDA